MRIVFWMESAWPLVGGRELLTAKLMASLRERGHDTLVITDHHDESFTDLERHDGVDIHRLWFYRGLASRDIDAFVDLDQQARQIVEQFRPDVIHMHDIGCSGVFCRRLLRRSDSGPADSTARPALLITMHCCLDEILKDHIEQVRKSGPTLLESADWVTGVSSAALASVRSIAPGIEPRSSVLTNGLAPPHIAPTDLPFDPPMVLCLGRLEAIKGFDLAIDAFARLAKRFTSLKLLIAGDGKARAALARQAAELHVADRVEFLGMVDSAAVWDTINRATLVVMPSRTEGFPLVALEAMLMARPIVASRAGGLPEAIVDGQTGLLVNIEDVCGLADATASLLTDPSRSRRMGLAGRARAIEQFSWERNVVDGYESLYRRLIDGLAREPGRAIE